MVSAIATRRITVAEILGHIERTRAGGHGSTVLIEGEGGIGKSTLLNSVATAATALGVTVIRASASEIDRNVPFGPLLATFEIDPRSSYANDWQRFPTDDRRTTPRVSPLELVPSERTHVIERIAGAIESWSVANPMLLMLDDVHWADPATLATLSRLRRLTSTQPFTMVATFRSAPHNPELRALVAATAHEGGDVRLLGSLDAAAVSEFLIDATGNPPTPALLAVALRAGGNPFLTNELLSALSRDGRITIRDGFADIEGDTAHIVAPRTGFRDVILSRMADLTPESARLLQIGAVLGGSFAVIDVAAMLGQPVATLLPLVATAVNAGLLEEDGRRLRFRHDLVREAIESTIGGASLAALHLDIARHLAAADAPATRVAKHYALGADFGDRTAVGWLRTAASQVVSRAPTSAAELLQRALALTPVGDPERDAVVAELVDAAFWSGEVDQAASLAGAALSRPLPPATEAALHETMIRALIVLGRPAEAVASGERLVELSEQPAWAMALTAVLKLFALDLDGAIGDANRSIALCAERDDPWAETLALCVASWEENARGFHRPAVALADRAVRAADRSPNAEAHRLVPHLYRGLALESAGRTADAQATLAYGQELAEQLGTAWATPFYHYALALTPWNAGRWDALQAEIEAGLRYAREHDIGLVASFACGLGATGLLYQGNLLGAEALLDEGDARLARGGVQYGVDWLLRGRALLLEARGDAAGALEILRLGWDVADGLKAAAILVVLGPDLVRIALDLGDDVTARMAADGLTRDTIDEARLNVDAHGLRCQGMVNRDVELLLEARRIHAECQRPVEVVQDDEALVLTLARLGRLDEAAALLDRCLDGCEALGITLIPERLRSKLSAIGLKKAKRPVVPAVSGWDALTQTERLVATYVATGLTNPQIATEMLISRRTVESHLYHVFAKLEVTNRTALAIVAVARSGGDGTG